MNTSETTDNSVMQFSVKRVITVLLYFGAVPVSLFTLFGFLSGLAWQFELLCHFRVQYFLILVLAALGFLILRGWWSFSGCVVFALANALLIVPFYLPRHSVVSSSSSSVRLLSLNVNTENREFASVRKLIDDNDPDLILLLEVNYQWLEELEPLDAIYPYHLLEARTDNFGIAFFSKYEFTDEAIVELGNSGVPTVVAVIDIGGKRFRFIGTHPLPPVSLDYYHLRNDQLRAIADDVRDHGSSIRTLVAGDLNVTPWSADFKQLLQDGNLSNSAIGFGIQASWPVGPVALLRIPLDHVLYSEGIVIVDRFVGGDAGSDHYPVFVDFVIEN